MFNIHFSIERWKFNKEYNVYVSNQGRFKDKDKKEIFPAPCQGYLIFRLGSIWIPAHRLVLKTWMPVADETLTVDHINHNKRDNSLKNLRWLSKKENEHDEALETFIEGVKEIGAFEYIHGLRGTPDLSSNRRKNVYRTHGLNPDGSVKTKQKKNKKEKIKEEIPAKTAMKIEGLKKTTIFDVSRETDAAQGLNYEQAVQYIHSKTGVKANKIKHYLCAYLNEGRIEQNRFGYTIRFHYEEVA